VVGTSGSGKSTVGNLLMRYYEPLSGDILVDGNPIQTLDTDWLRHNITLVQQESVLFNETIRQNISFGNRDHCRTEAVTRACETACLAETLDDMPGGLDTVVGLGGRSLSGGQQQRVAIARARLRDAPILILDESTSALDHTSRVRVMQAIREWRQGKTTIIITHDMSQILDDDYVYVLDHGKLVQEGYRKKLAAKTHGAFASILCSHEEKEPEQEPPAPMQVFEEEDFSHRWRYISNVFGPSKAAPGSTTGLPISSGRRPSGSDLIWTSPVATNSRRMSSILQPDLSFISPRSLSAPSRVEKETEHAVRAPTWNTINYKHESLGSRRRSRATTDTTAVSSRPPVHHRPPARPAQDPAPAPGPDDQAPASLARIFGSIWPTLSRRNRVVFVSGFAAAFVVAVGTPAFAYIFSRLLNVFYLPRAERAGQALRWALWLLAVAVVDGLACFGTHYALESSAQAWITALRLAALERILAQPKAWFEQEANAPGRLSECLDRNAEEMRNLVGRFAGLVFTVFWMLGISVAVSFAISWQLTLVALGCGPVVYAIMWVFHLVSSRWEERCNGRAEAASSIFTETFSHIRVVRALTLENYFARKHRQATVDAYQTGLRRAAYSGSLFGLSDAVTFFIMAGIFYYGTVLISSGSHPVGSILQVINLLLFGMSNGSSMMSMVPQISSSRATATSMLRLANLPLHASHESHGSARLPSPLPIQMTDLSFTHSAPPHARTLSSISLRIAAGTCTAIVGPSGSGKSTLLSVLQCLYPPDAAEPGAPSPLTFAGVPANQCSVAGLREHIASVPQAPVLFPATILANIVYGLPETSPLRSAEAAQRAAEQAGIHDFIASLDEGYGTRIGEGGMGLSGGQAQRVAIARAVVRRPRVLVLDEGTSGLDGEGAEGVRRVVRGMVESGVAAVVVSHGVEMMRSADRVVVVEDGRVVEEGGFEELCDRGGALARLIGVEARVRTR
jgi:ATP-binding cassette subfamily B (MDR/TAP) protein 1